MKRTFWGDKWAPGPERDSGVARVEDLMIKKVVTTTPERPLGHARELMTERQIHSLPIVDQEGMALGILTTSDLVRSLPDDTPIEQVMTRNVFTVPRYSGVHEAARVMRKHRIHHVVITHDKKVVGIVSSFDLLQLVEDKRFVRKNLPSTKRQRRKKKGQRPAGGSVAPDF